MFAGDAAGSVADVEYLPMLETFISAAAEYLGRYTRLSSLVGPSDASIVDQLIAHDAAAITVIDNMVRGRPANLAEAEEISPLLNPVVPNPADLALDMETPSGEVFAIDDPVLLRQLGASADDGHSPAAVVAVEPWGAEARPRADAVDRRVGQVRDQQAAVGEPQHAGRVGREAP